MERKRVVVTGMGTLTPVGNNVQEMWQSLITGKSGIGPITYFDASNFRTQIAAELKDFEFNHEDFKDKKLAKRAPRFIQYALVATKEALLDADLRISENVNPEDIGVIIGSGIGGLDFLEEQIGVLLEKGPSKVSPYLVPKMIADSAAGWVSIEVGAKGPNYCVVTACASGANSIGAGFSDILFGQAKVMITGGAEHTICPIGIAGFDAGRALSNFNKDSCKASRPFDAQRDGFVMGEGAGTLILEELEHARARGAKIYAELVGYGISGDAYHITAPDPEGQSQAMKKALKLAGIRPEEIDYINTHGTSTKEGDRTETKSLKQVFGNYAYKVSISSTKSMMGHLIGATGAVEAIVCIKAINEGIIPPTINYENPDPECDLNYVPNQAIRKKVKVAMSNSFGFGGHNVTLIFKKYEE